MRGKPEGGNNTEVLADCQLSPHSQGAASPKNESFTERFDIFEPFSSASERKPRSTTEYILQDARVQSYILKPRTRLAWAICACFWLSIAAGLFALNWWVLPLFLKNVVVPIQETVQKDWSKVAVAFLVIAGVAVVPIILLPAGPFMWLAAVSLGVWKGYLIVQVGTAIGMTTSYILGKQLLRERVQRWIEKKDWAEALFIAVKEAGPFKVVLLMRLGPAPYAWLSYACSLSSDIRFLPYIAASFIGRSPHNLIDIFIGSGVSAAGEAAQGVKLDAWLIAVYVVGFLLAVGVSFWGYIYAKRALKQLRARALAREQVLTAFNFPELEEFDEGELPLVTAGTFEELEGSGQMVSLEPMSRNSSTSLASSAASGEGGYTESPRQGWSDRRSMKVSRFGPPPKRKGGRGPEAHLIADCRAEQEEESLLRTQTPSAEQKLPVDLYGHTSSTVS